MRFRQIIFVQLILFISIFISGFLDLGGMPLLVLTALFLVSSIILLLRNKKSIRVNRHLILTGFSGILFSAGLVYGIYGIWGYYDIHNVLYIGIVAIGWLGYIAGTVLNLLAIRKGEL